MCCFRFQTCRTSFVELVDGLTGLESEATKGSIRSSKCRFVQTHNVWAYQACVHCAFRPARTDAGLRLTRQHGDDAAAGCWLLAAMLAAGCWLLAAGCHARCSCVFQIPLTECSPCGWLLHCVSPLQISRCGAVCAAVADRLLQIRMWDLGGDAVLNYDPATDPHLLDGEHCWPLDDTEARRRAEELAARLAAEAAELAARLAAKAEAAARKKQEEDDEAERKRLLVIYEANLAVSCKEPIGWDTSVFVFLHLPILRLEPFGCWHCANIMSWHTATMFTSSVTVQHRVE